MHIHRYEKYWLMFGFAAIFTFLAIIFYMAFSQGHHPGGGMHTIDPAKVESTPPFDKPGVNKIGENEYEVNLIAMTFGYNPAKIELPAGAKVTFNITSKDVIHSFTIPGTNINMEIIPGHISSRSYTFDKTGNYLVLCNEYCGAAHHMMQMDIEVKSNADKQ